MKFWVCNFFSSYHNHFLWDSKFCPLRLEPRQTAWNGELFCAQALSVLLHYSFWTLLSQEMSHGCVTWLSYFCGHFSSRKKYKLSLTFTTQREYWNMKKLIISPLSRWEHFLGNQDVPTLQNFRFLHSYLFLLGLPFKFVIWHLELFLPKVWPFLFSVFWH